MQDCRSLVHSCGRPRALSLYLGLCPAQAGLICSTLHTCLDTVCCPVATHRETDESIQELQFINLSYVQAQHDYLAGNYPVVREDAAQVL
jgi:hypothetical protein